jgi:CHAT domain-containing protein
MKKILLFLMILLPMAGSAQSSTNFDNWIYEGDKSITEYRIPDGVRVIGDEAFMNCEDLTSITIPESVTSIGASAFELCTSLKNVFIPKNVKEIKSCAFSSCYSLQGFEVDEDNPYFTTIDGVLFCHDKTKLVCCPNKNEYSIPNGTKIIGLYAFQGCKDMTSVTIPNSVEIIEEGAFSICNGLTSITIPKSVKKIGSAAFWKSENLKTVNLPEGITEIKSSLFKRCKSLETIIIPNSVKKIDDYAFLECESLQNITISKSVEIIGELAFLACSNLSSIIIPKSVKSIGDFAFQKCVSLKNVTIENGVEHIGKYVFSKCNSLTSISIPNSVNEIDTCAFWKSENLKTVNLPEGITEIKRSTFEECKSLESITIPGSVKSIGDYAFKECSNLKNVTIKNGVEEIKWNAFKNCVNLKQITIPGSVKKIGSTAFEGCDNLESVTIKNGVEVIGFEAFKKCYNLKQITIPGSVKTIDFNAFEGCNTLESVTIKNGVEIIGWNAFKNCVNLKQITIPGSVKEIDNNTFENCSSLESVTIENGVEEIGWNAFKNCVNLKSITIPGSVKTIDSNTFENCSSLESVTIENGMEEIEYDAFKNCINLKQITISGNVKIIYSSSFEGCDKLESVIIENEVEKISSSAFKNCVNLKSITISGSVKKIPDSAFEDWNNLESVTIENGVEEIEERAFLNCNIDTIYLPKSIKELGVHIFDEKTIVIIDPSNPFLRVIDGVVYNAEIAKILETQKNNASIVISGNVKKIPDSAFEGWNNLESVIIENGVEEIKWNAFKNCVNLKSITIPGSVKKIPANAFEGCKKLESVTIENGVEEIEWNMFDDCINLKSITIPGSVKKIPVNAFNGWKSLESVTIKNGVEEIKERAFLNCNIDTIYLPKSIKELGVHVFDEKTIVIIDPSNPFLRIIDGVVYNAEIAKILETQKNKASIVIPGNVKKIPANAFEGCKKLESVIIENGVEEIKWNAFKNCVNLKQIAIPGSVKKINSYAFEGCSSLESVIIENGVEEIDDYAFQFCSNLKSITIPGSVKKIDGNTFENCSSLESVTIENGVEEIGWNAFENCVNLKSITIPSSVKKIGSKAFEDCNNLESVTIENGVEEIYVSAFYNCNIDTIYLPKSVRKIEPYKNSKGKLPIIMFNPSNQFFKIFDGIVYNNDMTQLIYCQSSKSYINIPSCVKIIGKDAFSDCDKLSSINIPGSIKIIGEYAFSNCDKLKSVTIGNGVEEIEHSAFQDCSNITSITIPGSVKIIKPYTFKNCFNLNNCIITNGTKYINAEAFANCTNLQQIVIPESIIDIYQSAFSNCNKLSNIVYKDSNKEAIVLKIKMYNCMIKEKNDSLQIYADKILKILNNNHNHIYYYTIAELTKYYLSIGAFDKVKKYGNIIFSNNDSESTDSILKIKIDLVLLQYTEACIKTKDISLAEKILKSINNNAIIISKYKEYLNYLLMDKTHFDIFDISRFYLNQDITMEQILITKYESEYGDENVDIDCASLLFYYEVKIGELLFQAIEQIRGNEYINEPIYGERNEEEVFEHLKDDILQTTHFSNCNSTITSLYTTIGNCYYGPKNNFSNIDSAFTYYCKAFEYELPRLKQNFSFMNSYQRQCYWQEHQTAFENITRISAYMPKNQKALDLAYNSLLVSKGLILASEQNLSSAILNSNDNNLINDFLRLKQYRNEMDTVKDLKTKESLRDVAEKLETDLMKRSSQFADITNYMNIDWQKVRNSLGDNDVAVEFFFNNDSLYALVLKKDFDAPKLVVLDGFNTKLSYYTNTDIYNSVWKPLEQYLSPDGKVYFSPSGVLYNIAIEYAPMDATHLISEKYKIYRISSTRNLALKKEQSSKNKVGAVFGGIEYNFGKGDWEDLKEYADNIQVAFRDVPLIEDTTLRSGVSYLAGSKLEYEAVSKILKDANYQLVENTTGITATEELFKKLSGQGISNMLISTHGFYQPKDTVVSNSYEKEDISLSQSGLLLAGANSALDPQKRANIPEGVDDGILTAKEISRMDLKGLDLVVLSACQTGLGEVTSEGVFGLQRGFKKAGANTIVMSLWKVDDNATKDLMTEFYKNLVSGKSKREAFLAAQAVLRSKYKEPHKWAAFVMVDGVE